MVRERYWIDGWELTDGYYRDVEVRDGMGNSTPPSTQASDVYIVGRHGILDPVRLTADAGAFALQMWVLENRWSAADADYQLLLRAAGQYARSSHHLYTRGDGSQVECQARLTDAIEPVPLGQLGMRLQCGFKIPSAFWQDVQYTTDTTAPGSLSLPLASKALASAPMTDLVYTVTGPITNPKVAVVTALDTFGDYFQFNGIIPGGASLTVQAGTWTITASGMAAPTLDTVLWTGNNLLEVAPAPPGSVPTLALSGSGTTSSTRLSVAGHAKYAAA